MQYRILLLVSIKNKVIVVTKKLAVSYKWSTFMNIYISKDRRIADIKKMVWGTECYFCHLVLHKLCFCCCNTQIETH